MKKRFFRHINILLLLCVFLLQACPVSAADGIRIYTTEMQTAELASYAFQASAVDFSVSHMYRDQLATDEQKALYNLFVQATPADNTVTLTIDTLPALPEATAPDFQAKLGEFLAELVLPAYAAAVQDTPMLFWTGRIGYSCSISILGTKAISIDAICTAFPGDGFTEQNYGTMCQEIENALKRTSFQEGNRADLLKQFHDYLCNNIVYIDSAYAHNIYGALAKGEAVCEGYAKTFKLLCDLYDIPCMLLTGNAITSTGFGPHAWNAVRMEDGKWYAVDVTWDDQGKIYYDFFLIGSQTVPESFMKITFAESHLPDGDFYGNGLVKMQMPTLSEDGYTHTHIYESIVTVAPTCQSEGVISYTCVGCELGYFETLPMIAHDYQDDICVMCGVSAPISGDCNGDEVLDCKDAVRLLRYLAAYDPATDTSAVTIGEGADCNGDGRINSLDVTHLLRYLANIDPATGKSSVELIK